MNPGSSSSSVDSSQIEVECTLDAPENTSDCDAGSVEPKACTIVREEMSELAAEVARWLAWQSDGPK